MLKPPDVYIKDTGTPKGKGVFAARNFSAGETIEIAPVMLFKMNYYSLPRVIKNYIFDWEMLAGAAKTHALALGYGSFYNHNNPANMRYEADAENESIRFVAVRNIDADEELTINYSAEGGAAESDEENDNGWFADHKITPIID